MPTLIPGSDKVVGVKFNDPPPHLRKQVDAQILTALDTSSVEPGEAALVGILTDVGWNSALVVKTKSGFELETFIGSNWGTRINVGARIQKKIKLGR